ncbi:MAG: class I SAM-dependent methyltransferase [Candidatus Ryanbacteria bacterium]|nr:class I SAM-dependent methyltransferase [Candidatus Ryanbacteria bacterium]
MSGAVADHFDHVAGSYDFWKQKNFYYYNTLKTLCRSFVPKGSVVAEIGCGTGDILAALEPSRGLGIDVSPQMIEIAKKKHSTNAALSFAVGDVCVMQQKIDAPFVVMTDVLEHVGDSARCMENLSHLVSPRARVVVTLANPLWEPVLSVAEKLSMKMPEGPHERITIAQNEQIFAEKGFRIVEKGYRLLIPKKIPGADWLNARFYQWPLLRRFGFIIFWVLEYVA